MGSVFSFWTSITNRIGQDDDQHDDIDEQAVKAVGGQGEGTDNIYEQWIVNGPRLFDYALHRGWIQWPNNDDRGLPCPQCWFRELFWQTTDQNTNVLKCICGIEIATLHNHEFVKNRLIEYVNHHKWCVDWISYYVQADPEQLWIKCDRCDDVTMLS